MSRFLVSAWLVALASLWASAPSIARTIDDFEEGPFAVGNPGTKQTTITGLSAGHVIGGVRSVAVDGLGVTARLNLSAGDDGMVLSYTRLGCDLTLTYPNLAGVDLTDGGASDTLLVSASSVSVTIDGQTLLVAGGTIPLSSFDQIDPTHVDTITLRVRVLESGLPGRWTLFDVRTGPPNWQGGGGGGTGAIVAAQGSLSGQGAAKVRPSCGREPFSLTGTWAFDSLGGWRFSAPGQPPLSGARVALDASGRRWMLNPNAGSEAVLEGEIATLASTACGEPVSLDAPLSLLRLNLFLNKQRTRAKVVFVATGPLATPTTTKKVRIKAKAQGDWAELP